MGEDYVWYAGYGSNLSKQRFLCYILGGKPKYGMTINKGCSNKSPPSEDRPIEIPYILYFALPKDKKGTSMWGRGGVAFLAPEKINNAELWTLGRMWKITKDQYEEVKRHEGEGYNNEIFLGKDENGIPIYTITNKTKLKNVVPPSERYLKTIILGLKETYSMSNEEICSYLINKEGIKNYFTYDKLLKIAEAVVL